MQALRFTAGHLPGLAPGAVAHEVLRFTAHGQALEVRVPRPTPQQLQAVAAHVRAHAAQVLQPLPASTVVDLLDAAIARLLDAADPLRRELDALLPVVTGTDPELLQRTLTAYLQAFRGPQLHRFLAGDFANPKVLDGFQPSAKGGLVCAVGPALAAHVWAGNTPGLPLWSLACGLLAKGGTVGKLPSAEPVVASIAARALAAVHPPLADCLAIAWWPGGDEAPAAALFAEAELVLAYGGQDTLRQLRALVPASVRFLGYGHKLGLALAARAALDQRRGPVLARRAALDIARHEQQGCYSPQVLYVEEGGALSPRAFAEHLAGALAALQRQHPRAALALEDAAAVAAWRAGFEWREGVQLLGDADAGWAIALADRPLPPQPSPGRRCVLVCATPSLDAVVPLLAPHRAFLQTVGLAADPAGLLRLAGLLGAAGATRIAPIGGMAQPEPGWHHDGGCSVADLVRWVEIDGAAERAADGYAAYAQDDAA